MGRLIEKEITEKLIKEIKNSKKQLKCMKYKLKKRTKYLIDI